MDKNQNTKPQIESTVEEMAEVQIMRAPDYKLLFANHLRMMMSAYEIGIIFGYREVVPGVGQVATESATAMMTPHVAKKLSIALGESIKAFEESFGPIDITPKNPVSGEDMLEAIKRAQSEAMKKSN